MGSRERLQLTRCILVVVVAFVGGLQGSTAWPFHLFEKPKDGSDGVGLGEMEQGFTPWLMHMIDDMVHQHRPTVSSPEVPRNDSGVQQEAEPPGVGEPRVEEWDGVFRHIMTLGVYDFDAHVNGHKQAMLLFCTRTEAVCTPVEREFDRLAELVTADTHLAHRTVVAYIDTEVDTELAHRFHIQGHPGVRYLGWGMDLHATGTLALSYTKSAEQLHDFLVDHLPDELRIFRTRVMDRSAHDFMFATSEMGRARAFEAGKEVARGLITARDKESARLYLLVMRDANQQGWYRFKDMEREFAVLQARIDTEVMDEDTRWQLEKRQSVMSAFLPSVEAKHNRRRALRFEKHIFGREVKTEL